jgi:DNA-binding phage protein
MEPLEVQDVLRLLRGEVDRVGGQSEWARKTGIDRAMINRVLNGRRLPPSHVCRALGLEWIIARHAQTHDQPKLIIVSNQAFLLILKEEIKKAGSIANCARRIGVNRSHLSCVLHKRRPPDKKILAALDLSLALVRSEGSEAAIRERWRQNIVYGRGTRHAQW